MPHKPPVIVVPIVIVVVLGVGGWFVERERAANRSTLSGFFEDQPSQVASKVGGRVIKIDTREGDFVRAGQPIIELDSASSHAALDAERAAFQQAKAHQSLIDAGSRSEEIVHQQEVVREARAELDKAVAGPRPQELEQCRANLGEAQAVYDRVVNGARPEEVAQARATAKAAKDRLDAAARGLTPPEIAQYKDRVDAAIAEDLDAAKDLQRYRRLLDAAPTIRPHKSGC